MTDLGLSTHCRLAKPGVFDGKVSGIFSGCRLEDFIQFYDCRRGRKWKENDGGERKWEGMADWGECVAGERERNRKILV